MINYILIEIAAHKDQLLKDKIIKLLKYFRRHCQFTPNNRQRTNKWTPRMPKDKLSSVPKYKIHQALIDMLHNDHSKPDDTLTTSQHNVHIVSTESNEQDEIDFLMH